MGYGEIEIITPEIIIEEDSDGNEGLNVFKSWSIITVFSTAL